MQRITELADSVSVLGCNEQTAQYYGTIKDSLRRIGRPIPENDIWIAAVAVQNDLTLITRDAHFEYIENLPRTAW